MLLLQEVQVTKVPSRRSELHFIQADINTSLNWHRTNMFFFCFRCKFLNFYSLNSILVVTNLVQSFVLNQRRLMEWTAYYIRNLGCYYATGGCVPVSRILVLGMDDVRSCDYDLEVQLL